MADTYTDEQLERGREKLRNAHAWRLKNPRAWAYLENIALQSAQDGKRVGGQQLVEAVRSHDFTDTEGKATRTNNDYAPIIARLLISDHPHLNAFIERRGCVFDVLMFPILEDKWADHDEQ